MSNAEIWVTTCGLILVSVLTRSFFLLFGTRLSVSARIRRALRYAPVGALIAIIIPEILVSSVGDGTLALSGGNPQLWGGIAAAIAMVWRRSMLITLLAGMLVYSLVRVGL